MPKPLSLEQLTELQANGVIVPGQEAPEVVMPAGLVQRALGATGLPNSVEVNRLGDSITSDTVTNPESHESEIFREHLNKSLAITNYLMILTGNPKTSLENFQKNEIDESECTYALYEQLGLEPDVVITPTCKTWVSWQNIFAMAKSNSTLNPRGVLRDNGLFINDQIMTEWNGILNKHTGDSELFRIEVVSGTSFPRVTEVTSYGYKDSDNEIPHEGLNNLLRDLGMPEITDLMTQSASGTTTLNQPECLPRVETYLMQQLTRIASGKNPVDKNSFSLLKGELHNEQIITGDFYGDLGYIRLSKDNIFALFDDVGVRPAGSAHHA